MLVLARKAGESVVIGNDIHVHVLRIKGQVHLGVQAPPDVKILRTEVTDRDKTTNGGNHDGSDSTESTMELPSTPRITAARTN